MPDDSKYYKKLYLEAVERNKALEKELQGFRLRQARRNARASLKKRMLGTSAGVKITQIIFDDIQEKDL